MSQATIYDHELSEGIDGKFANSARMKEAEKKPLIPENLASAARGYYK